jgi:Putative auto-transporter adhesin, head GIN domain
MSFVLSSLLMLGNAVFGVGCASARTVADAGSVRQTRTVGAFDKIDSGGAFEIIVDAAAPATSVVVEASSSVIDKITTEVHDGTLEIEQRSGTYDWKTGKMTVIIGAKSLAGLKMGGAGTATVKNVHGTAFSVSLTGAGSVNLAGTTASLSVSLDGAAHLDATALKAHSVTVSIGGTGSAKVWASDSLTADVSGVGSITYYGHPAHVQRTVSGVGSIGPG